MRKLSEKVGCSLSSDVDFTTRFKSCVYNSDSPIEFESTWKSIIDDFRLENNGWLSQLYENRHMWIPAYFKNVFLGAILKTTSRSESENNFFSNFTNPHLSLVEFWMRYESAIEWQRHRQLMADNDTFSSMPQLKTNRELEKHASQVYTYSNFYKFQSELWTAFMECELEERKEIEEGLVISILDRSKKDGKIRQVVYNPFDHVAHCSCKMFECEGIPCRHILFILKGKCLSELPSYYILNRWTKMAGQKPIFDVDGNVLEGCSKIDCEKKLISDNWLGFLNCMQVAGKDHELLGFSLESIENTLKQLKAKKSSTIESSKKNDFESFFGSSAPIQVDILPPKQSNNKGSGKRIKGGKEMAMEHQQKKTRLCRLCGEYAYHDSRNCPTKLAS